MRVVVATLAHAGLLAILALASGVMNALAADTMAKKARNEKRAIVCAEL